MMWKEKVDLTEDEPYEILAYAMKMIGEYVYRDDFSVDRGRLKLFLAARLPKKHITVQHAFSYLRVYGKGKSINAIDWSFLMRKK